MDYFIKVNVALALFYCFYQLALKQSAYFTANRAFLLSGMVLAFIIPALSFPSGNYLAGITHVPVETGLNAVLLDPVSVTAEPAGLPSLSPLQWLGLIYALIAGIFLLKILVALFRLLQLYRNNQRIQCDGYRLVLLENSKEPTFSFFSVIFVNEEDINRADKWIIRHELVHVRQHHSLDILASEILKAILWINPFAYLYQRSIRSVNEYLADAVIEPEEKSRYAELMYEYSFHSRPISLQNSFFNKTLLKRRIKMLHQKKSGKMRLAYLLIIPLLAGLVFTVSRAGNTGRTTAEPADISGISANAGQPVTVSGKVSDIMNAPLAGVSIFVKGTPHGTATDMEGRFELKNVPSDAELKFSMIGYETMLVGLNNNRVLNLRLDRKRQRLDEMVVVAYMPRPKKNTPVEEEVSPGDKEEAVYSFASIEKMPEFPGGKEAIIRHIGKRFRYPTEARNAKIQGTIEIGFVVDEEGNVTKPEVLKGLGKGCDEEAIRVIKTLPKWEAGEQNGVKVAVYYVLPLVLRVNE